MNVWKSEKSSSDENQSQMVQVPGNKRPVDVCNVIQVPCEIYLSLISLQHYYHQLYFQLELDIDDIPRENEKKYRDGMQVLTFNPKKR